MKDNKLVKTILIANIAIHIIVGILLIIFSNESFERNNYFIGGVLIVTGLPHIFIYLIGEGYKKFVKQPYLVFSFVSIVLGIVIMLCNELLPQHIYLIWGILDIVRSSYEIFDGIRELKESKLEIAEILAGLSDMILGFLLCFEKEEGVKLHIIIMGVGLIVVGIRFLIELIIKVRENNNQIKGAQ